MSWRDIARAAVQREMEAPDPRRHSGNFDNNADASTPADAIAEREAISIMDGGLPPEWAAGLGILERSPRPVGLSIAQWRASLDCLWTRADENGADFVANGWTFEEVFGVGAGVARLDHLGAAWFAPDARIVSIDPERIVFERASGDRTTTHRRPH
jgi:hypothetical protein